MFCTNCGKEIPENSNNCPSCGKEVKSGEINFSKINRSDVKNFITGKDVEQKAQEESRIKDLSDIIVDSDEEQIAVLGGGYLANMLHGGGLSKGFGILTDKRFYFKGKSYKMSVGIPLSISQEYIVDLEDITATGFTFIGLFWLRILAIVCYIAGVLVVPGLGTIGLLCCGLIGIVLMCIYRLTLRNYYEITFAGGSVRVDVSKYGGIKEVRAFNKALRMAKDKCK